MQTLITSLFVGVIMLTGCGQKGPLYIEQDKGPAVTTDTAVADESQRKDKQ